MGWVETTILTWRQSRKLLKKMKRMGLFLQDLNVGLPCANHNWNPKVTRWWFKTQTKLKSSWQIINLKPKLKPKTRGGWALSTWLRCLILMYWVKLKARSKRKMVKNSNWIENIMRNAFTKIKTHNHKGMGESNGPFYLHTCNRHLGSIRC